MKGFFHWSQVYWQMLLISVVHAGPVYRNENQTSSTEVDGIFSSIPTTPTYDPVDATSNVCLYEGKEYQEGQVRPSVEPCEFCTCHPPSFTCTTRSCPVRPGCKALHSAGQCCPEYVCDCYKNGMTYGNGEKVEEPNPCNVCYCRGGVIQCTGVTCYTRTDCEPHYVSGKCCPKYDHCPAIEPRLPTVEPDHPPIQPKNETITTAERKEDVPQSTTSKTPEPSQTATSPDPSPATSEASQQTLESTTKPSLDFVENNKNPASIDQAHVGTLEIIEVYPEKIPESQNSQTKPDIKKSVDTNTENLVHEALTHEITASTPATEKTTTEETDRLLDSVPSELLLRNNSGVLNSSTAEPTSPTMAEDFDRVSSGLAHRDLEAPESTAAVSSDNFSNTATVLDTSNSVPDPATSPVTTDYAGAASGLTQRDLEAPESTVAASSDTSSNASMVLDSSSSVPDPKTTPVTTDSDGASSRLGHRDLEASESTAVSSDTSSTTLTALDSTIVVPDTTTSPVADPDSSELVPESTVASMSEHLEETSIYENSTEKSPTEDSSAVVYDNMTTGNFSLTSENFTISNFTQSSTESIENSFLSTAISTTEESSVDFELEEIKLTSSMATATTLSTPVSSETPPEESASTVNPIENKLKLESTTESPELDNITPKNEPSTSPIPSFDDQEHNTTTSANLQEEKTPSILKNETESVTEQPIESRADLVEEITSTGSINSTDEYVTDGYEISEEWNSSNSTESDGPREYTANIQGQYPKGETPEKLEKFNPTTEAVSLARQDEVTEYEVETTTESSVRSLAQDKEISSEKSDSIYEDSPNNNSSSSLVKESEIAETETEAALKPESRENSTPESQKMTEIKSSSPASTDENSETENNESAVSSGKFTEVDVGTTSFPENTSENPHGTSETKNNESTINTAGTFTEDDSETTASPEILMETPFSDNCTVEISSAEVENTTEALPHDDTDKLSKFSENQPAKNESEDTRSSEKINNTESTTKSPPKDDLINETLDLENTTESPAKSSTPGQASSELNTEAGMDDNTTQFSSESLILISTESQMTTTSQANVYSSVASTESPEPESTTKENRETAILPEEGVSDAPDIERRMDIVSSDQVLEEVESQTDKNITQAHESEGEREPTSTIGYDNAVNITENDNKIQTTTTESPISNDDQGSEKIVQRENLAKINETTSPDSESQVTSESLLRNASSESMNFKDSAGMEKAENYSALEKATPTVIPEDQELPLAPTPGLGPKKVPHQERAETNSPSPDKKGIKSELPVKNDTETSKLQQTNPPITSEPEATEAPRKPENTAASLAEILLKWLESKKAKVNARKSQTENGRKFEAEKSQLTNVTEKKEEEPPVRSLLSALSTELMKIAHELPENETGLESTPNSSRTSNSRSLEFAPDNGDQSLEVHKEDIEVLAEALTNDGKVEPPANAPDELDDEPIHLRYPYTDESLAPVLSMISDQLQFLKVGEDMPIYFQQPDDDEGDVKFDGRSHQGVVITPDSSPITVDMVKVVNGGKKDR